MGRERKRKNDYALCQKAATGAGRHQALRVSVRQDLAGQAGTSPDKPGQTGSNRDKPALARTYRDRDKPGQTGRVKLHQSMRKKC